MEPLGDLIRLSFLDIPNGRRRLRSGTPVRVEAGQRGQVCYRVKNTTTRAPGGIYGRPTVHRMVYCHHQSTLKLTWLPCYMLTVTPSYWPPTISFKSVTSLPRWSIVNREQQSTDRLLGTDSILRSNNMVWPSL